MATGSVGTLFVDLVAKTEQFGRQLDRADRRAKRTERVFKSLAVAAGGIFSARLLLRGARALLDINREYERLNAQLLTVTGSQNAATAAFRELEKFAATTPFKIEENVQAFIRLKALGIDPTTETLTDFGNIASGFGRTIVDISRAVQGAVTGETEALKSFGIVSRIQGEQISFSFQGVTKTVNRSADEIVGALREIAQANFAGAMANEMDTLNGIISNFQDNLGTIARSIGEALLPQIKDVAARVRDFAGVIAANGPIVAAWADVIIEATKAIVAGFTAVVRAAFNMGQLVGNTLVHLSRILAGIATKNVVLVQVAWDDLKAAITADISDITQGFANFGAQTDAVALAVGRLQGALDGVGQTGLPTIGGGAGGGGVGVGTTIAGPSAAARRLGGTAGGLTRFGRLQEMARNTLNEQLREQQFANIEVAKSMQTATSQMGLLADVTITGFGNMLEAAIVGTENMTVVVLQGFNQIIQQLSRPGGIFGGVLGGLLGPIAGLGLGLAGALFGRRSEPQRVHIASLEPRAKTDFRDVQREVIRETIVFVREGSTVEETEAELARRRKRGVTPRRVG